MVGYRQSVHWAVGMVSVDIAYNSDNKGREKERRKKKESKKEKMKTKKEEKEGRR